MNSYEKFRNGFLLDLARPGMGDHRNYRHQQLATDYGISEAHVREVLLQLASAGIIDLRAWDGTRPRPWNEWADPKDMFFIPWDAGHVRVKLLAAGAEYVEDIPKRAIGFAAP